MRKMRFIKAAILVLLLTAWVIVIANIVIRLTTGG